MMPRGPGIVGAQAHVRNCDANARFQGPLHHDDLNLNLTVMVSGELQVLSCNMELASALFQLKRPDVAGCAYQEML